ncbi:LPXTG cell wall anchor domain-containing protein [Auritidibacter ignavus]|uniref:LPXTG cell wall anchor domain-containing protein n=1 Tax=Auritidibacter ignavus TaxID=678932 RepID=UPI0024BAB94B|nr:LPXTG cell wall anchor domain-containing protein [Auritidibacter ignavus]WHS34287.1 LPXTG cell wall anchor domain-containing protein [Auritidibacter ignavus]
MSDQSNDQAPDHLSDQVAQSAEDSSQDVEISIEMPDIPGVSEPIQSAPAETTAPGADFSESQMPEPPQRPSIDVGTEGSASESPAHDSAGDHQHLALTVDPTQTPAGSAVTLGGLESLAGQQVDAWFHSGPTQATSDSGSTSQQPGGDQTTTASRLDNGSVVSQARGSAEASDEHEASAGSSLAKTGATASGLVLLAGALVGCGWLLRRRHAHQH